MILVLFVGEEIKGARRWISLGFIALQPTNFKYICLGKYSEKNETTFNVLGNISKIMNFKTEI
jgi:cell division protein FtsW (lipid II flippase)